MSKTNEIDILSGLSSYLGAGLGDDGTTAEQYEDRIRWGINYYRNATIQQCADVVERLSKRPGTTWGEVRSEILKLQDPTPSKAKQSKQSRHHEHVFRTEVHLP